MEYRYLGRSGVRVSEICLGTMTFGNEADETVSRAIMERSVAAGVNFFDTANVYNKGVTEEIVGRWQGPHRDALVLATKAHFPMGDGVNDRGCSRRHLMLSVEASLRRLQTDRVDILYLHHWDANTALEESLGAISALIAQGKVLYCGVSNFAAWQVMKAVSLAREHGFAPITCLQPMYNVLKRQAEVEILPMAQSEEIGVCPYSPIGAGLLTGKYQRGERGRIDENDMYKRRYQDAKYREISERFAAYAKEKSVSAAALAVRWVLGHPGVSSAIVGARNVAQLEDTLACVDLALSPKQREDISALSVAPPLATDRES